MVRLRWCLDGEVWQAQGFDGVTLSGNRWLMSALPPKGAVERTSVDVSYVLIVLQKSFCTGDQKFSGL
jgi:hypothetical protein